MRKLLLIGLLAGALAAGCGSNTKRPNPAPPVTPAPTTTPSSTTTAAAPTTTTVPAPPTTVTLPHTD